jgi:hypothetical protein
MILSGKLIPEEDQLITLLNNSRTCSARWLLSTQLKDQKLKK